MRTSVARKIRRSAGALVLLLASTLGVVAAAGPAQAAGSCQVSFRPSTWTVDANDNPNVNWDSNGNVVWNGIPTAGVGFLGTFEITNTGDAIDSWTVAWMTAPNTRLVGAGIFNATLTRRATLSGSGTVWWAKAPEWNQSLPSGGRTSFGFQGVVPNPDITASQILGRFVLAGRICTNVT